MADIHVVILGLLGLHTNVHMSGFLGTERLILSAEVDLHNVLINTEKTFIHIHTDAFQG